MATALFFVLGTTLIVLLVYGGARVLLARFSADDTKDLAGSIIFRVSALHALLLGLVFAAEISDYQAVRAAAVEEATIIADLYFDLDRYGGDHAPARGALAAYVALVVDDEWSRLGETGRLTAEGWEHRETVYRYVLDLRPGDPRQEALRDRMIQRAQIFAELRQARENAARAGLPMLFWLASVLGVVVVAACYFAFPPTALNIFLIGVLGAFTGMVLLFIHALSMPLASPGALAPTAFERLLEGEIGVAARALAGG